MSDNPDIAAERRLRDLFSPIPTEAPLTLSFAMSIDYSALSKNKERINKPLPALPFASSETDSSVEFVDAPLRTPKETGKSLLAPDNWHLTTP